LDRALGKAASAPEDIAATVAAANGPAQFLALLMQLRATAQQQQQMLDITPAPTPDKPTTSTD